MKNLVQDPKLTTPQQPTIYYLFPFQFVTLIRQPTIYNLFTFQFVTLIRQVGGRRNLARKTLIDKRFLI